MTPTPSTFSKVLPYKREAYCRTNGRRSLFSRLRSREAPAIQMGGGAYCRTNWRLTAVLSSRPVGVGVSETLLTDCEKPQRQLGFERRSTGRPFVATLWTVGGGTYHRWGGGVQKRLLDRVLCLDAQIATLEPQRVERAAISNRRAPAKSQPNSPLNLWKIG